MRSDHDVTADTAVLQLILFTCFKPDALAAFSIPTDAAKNAETVDEIRRRTEVESPIGVHGANCTPP